MLSHVLSVIFVSALLFLCIHISDRHCKMALNDDDKYLVFKYPKITATVFSRQSDALEFAKKNLNSERVFSRQLKRNYRNFHVCDVESFYKYYSKVTEKHFYEVIPTGAPVKLFLDLEYYTRFNANSDGNLMTKELVSIFDSCIQNTFGIKDSKKESIILDSSNQDKFSQHVIFSSVVFRSIEDCRNFVHQVITTFTEEQTKMFQVQTSDGSRLFIDKEIYTKNRHFRLFMSSKFGENRPLLCRSYKDKEVSNNQVLFKEIFSEALVTNINSVSGSQSYLACNLKVLVGYPAPEPTNVKGTTVTNSPYKTIDKLVEKLSSPGTIRKITFNSIAMTVRYDIAGQHYCRTKNGIHHSNNIYYKYFSKSKKLIQDCYSPNCVGKTIHEIEIPFFVND